MKVDQYHIFAAPDGRDVSSDTSAAVRGEELAILSAEQAEFLRTLPAEGSVRWEAAQYFMTGGQWSFGHKTIAIISQESLKKYL